MIEREATVNDPDKQTIRQSLLRFSFEMDLHEGIRDYVLDETYLSKYISTFHYACFIPGPFFSDSVSAAYSQACRP